jgi:hypothetical protein
VNADGEEFGHPFAEPERQHRERPSLFPENVALEGVDEFVPKDVIGFAKAGSKRQDDTAGEMIGEPADPFRDGPGQDRRSA